MTKITVFSDGIPGTLSSGRSGSYYVDEHGTKRSFLMWIEGTKIYIGKLEESQVYSLEGKDVHDNSNQRKD